MNLQHINYDVVLRVNAVFVWGAWFLCYRIQRDLFPHTIVCSQVHQKYFF